jgi:hypothetical protein
MMVVGNLRTRHVSQSKFWKHAVFIIDYIDYVTGIGNTRMRNAATPYYGYLATGEGKKKVCPDLAITELSERSSKSTKSVSAWHPFRSLVRSLCYL